MLLYLFSAILFDVFNDLQYVVDFYEIENNLYTLSWFFNFFMEVFLYFWVIIDVLNKKLDCNLIQKSGEIFKITQLGIQIINR